jgi:hypothetical protein
MSAHTCLGAMQAGSDPSPERSNSAGSLVGEQEVPCAREGKMGSITLAAGYALGGHDNLRLEPDLNEVPRGRSYGSEK